MKDEKKFTYAKNQGNAMFVSYKMCSSVGVKRLRTYFLIDQFFSGKLIFLFNSSLESWRKKRKKNTCATASGLQFPNETGLYLSIFFVQNICTCGAKISITIICICLLFCGCFFYLRPGSLDELHNQTFSGRRAAARWRAVAAEADSPAVNSHYAACTPAHSHRKDVCFLHLLAPQRNYSTDSGCAQACWRAHSKPAWCIS